MKRSYIGSKYFPYRNECYKYFKNLFEGNFLVSEDNIQKVKKLYSFSLRKIIGSYQYEISFNLSFSKVSNQDLIIIKLSKLYIPGINTWYVLYNTPYKIYKTSYNKFMVPNDDIKIYDRDIIKGNHFAYRLVV